MSESNTPERRVYHLPLDLLERLRAYQSEQKIPSEVEAVRRLLNIALEMRDTVETILKQLQVRFVEEGDLRLLASEILARHSLVTEVRFADESVWFKMRSGRKGQIDSKGTLSIGEPEDDDEYMRRWTPPPPKAPAGGLGGGKANAPKAGGGGWDAPAPKADLDDDIPF